MKLDSKLYREAQAAVRTPRMRLLMLGAICGAIVPTVYIRNYFLPKFAREDLQDISDLAVKGNVSSVMEPEARKTKPVMKLWPMLNAKQREDLMMKSSAVGGPQMMNDRFGNDESTMVMFSSIM